MAKKRKLMRDKVISVVNGKALVGVYWEGTDLGSPSARKDGRKKQHGDAETRRFAASPHRRVSDVAGRRLRGKEGKKKEAGGSEILFECSPEKADRIIEIFNGDEGGSCEWQDRETAKTG